MLTEVADPYSRLGETPHPDNSQQTRIRGRQKAQPVPQVHGCGFLHHETHVTCGSQLNSRDTLWTNPSTNSGKLVKGSCVWKICIWSASSPFLPGRSNQKFGSEVHDVKFTDTGRNERQCTIYLPTHFFNPDVMSSDAYKKIFYYECWSSMSGHARGRRVLLSTR